MSFNLQEMNAKLAMAKDNYLDEGLNLPSIQRDLIKRLVQAKAKVERAMKKLPDRIHAFSEQELRKIYDGVKTVETASEKLLGLM